MAVQVGSVLFGADQAVMDYVSKKCDGAKFAEWSSALGVVSQGKLIGGVVYHESNGNDVRVSFALEPGYFYPWRALFSYPFNHLGVIRLTALIAKNNKKSRYVVEALGFQHEGTHPMALKRKYTMLSYGMTRDQCRWIRKAKENG